MSAGGNNHTKPTNILCGQKQFSKAKMLCKGLMLFRERINIYSDNHTKYTNILCGQHGVPLNLQNRWYFYYPLCFEELLNTFTAVRYLQRTCTRIFLPWRWGQYVPPKRRFTQELHGATSQKTAFFIVTAVKISNLANSTILRKVKPFWNVKLWNTLPAVDIGD
jgi:hypothetical protein